MRRTRLTASFLAVAVMMLGLVASPAGAQTAGVVVFEGTADTPAGLYAPLLDPRGNPTPQDDHTWSFDSATGSCTGAGIAAGAPAVGNCTINAAGDLTYVTAGRTHPVPDGIVPDHDLPIAGPYCGISQGDNGTGSFTDPNGDIYTLSNVGWITSAGGTLPVTGDWAGAQDSGTLVSLVQAQGGQPCLDQNGPGATTFTVVGVSAFVGS